MMEFTILPATLDDWQDIKTITRELQDSKFSAIVGASEQEAQGFLINSITMPHGVGFLMLRWRGILVGIAALMAMDAPKPGVLGVYAQVQRHCFIHSVYIQPVTYTGSLLPQRVPKEAGNHMLLGVETWAKARGAVWMYGNVRLDGRFGGLWRKFGMAPQHGVAGKGVATDSGLGEVMDFSLHQVVVGKELVNG